MTYQNLGFWIGQANDTSTGRHPTGWSNGQRWSETSGEWMVMYDGSQSALGSMTADRDYWYNAAHGDPNVWTNRYNAGYAQGSADKMPAGSAATPLVYNSVCGIQVTDSGFLPVTGLAGASGPLSAVSGNRCTLARAGYYYIMMRYQIGGGAVASSQGGWLRFRINGDNPLNGDPRHSESGSKYTGGNKIFSAGTWWGNRNAGDYVDFEGQNNASNGMNLEQATVLIIFVPTPTYPH